MRFLKNSISSWTFLTGNVDSYGDSAPDGIAFDSKNWLFTNNGAILGVYQQLSTRNGGEVISAARPVVLTDAAGTRCVPATAVPLFKM